MAFAPGCELVFIEGCGQALRATRALCSGDLILESRPEVVVLYSDYAASHCAQCYEATALPEGSCGITAAAAVAPWLCAECSSFALCATCNAEPDGATARTWHRSGECAAFVAVPAHLRQGDSDYLRWFLRYFDRRRRGPPPPPPGASSLAPTASDARELSPDVSAATASMLPAATSSHAESGLRSLLHLCPFGELVALEELQTVEFKEWAVGFAKLLVQHCEPPDGLGVDEVR